MRKILLKEINTRAPDEMDKADTKKKTEKIVMELDDLQNLLYAEGKHSILIILQGMDASGKDGVIRNVFGKMNPQGVNVTSFKGPTSQELSHDFLWRIHEHSPEKGKIRIFNRSHYEDILITRVHGWCDDALAKKRIRSINDFERLLTEQNQTHILKFYLHVSEEEQQERLQERLHNPAKMWKYNKKDFTEAKLRDKYIEMYEDCFEFCNEVPWTIVPSDQNWYKEFIIASQFYELLKSLNMQFPVLEK